MPMNIGELVIDFIIESRLIWTDPAEPTVLVWAANAPEQLREFIMRMSVLR